MNIISCECLSTILRKKNRISHRHCNDIQLLSLSQAQTAVSVTRKDHVMGSKVQ